MDKKTLESLRRLVIYAAIEEGKNYEEAGRPRNHIFRDVMRLARFLDIKRSELQ
jgi:hypothetical protein